MRIGLCLFGMTYSMSRHNHQVDFRHCWSNIHKMLILPFEEQGHTVKIFTCTYFFEDVEIRNDFHEMIKPTESIFITFAGSNKSTCKKNLFRLIQDRSDIDFVIYTRFDLHFNKIIVNENIDYYKFNFLFWEDTHISVKQYTTDNLYMWPYHMTNNVYLSLIESVNHREYFDTHALYIYLSKRITEDNIHFLSNKRELSDTNSFYTLCIPDMVRDGRTGIHPEVIERFSK